ncbi:MAG: hypothetical protein F6K42_17680 [Leptolyngbya sp. SIO1D8]|nr:hypothetical protein [Leptolyngbya sp. SIO1D8]
MAGSPSQSVAPPKIPTPTVQTTEKAALPFLPKAKRMTFSSHRNDANAALALDLLGDVEKAISGWHQALRQILLDIQALYLTGPIIDGWLEAVPNQTGPGGLGEEASVLRHGDAAQVAAYIEKIARMSPSGTAASSGTQYRLCSLDTDGQMQCQICPQEELGVISQAIARHHQLRQLLSQKQYLEARLKRAAEALEVTRQTLGITTKPCED